MGSVTVNDRIPRRAIEPCIEIMNRISCLKLLLQFEENLLSKIVSFTGTIDPASEESAELIGEFTPEAFGFLSRGCHSFLACILAEATK